MRTARFVPLLTVIFLSAATAPICPASWFDPLAIERQPPETLERNEGGRVPGRLEIEPEGRLKFTPRDGSPALRLEPGMTVAFPGNGPPASTGLPPFRVELGLNQRVSGRLAALNDREIVLYDALGEGKVTIARAGARALLQRAGESLVLQDGFESLDTRRWAIVGEPEIVESPRLSGAHSLSAPAGGTSLTYRVPEPFGSGRLELAFYDSGVVVAEQKWFVDLTFRGPNGPETVRAVLGWSEESLAVETVGGPALAVQRLARARGWHRLTIRFAADRCEVGVDGNELAHGKCFGGPVTEIRLATSSTGKSEPPDDLATRIDDLRLVRFAEPVGELEIDASQDEVRLTGGDQVFGKVTEADPEQARVNVDGRDVSLGWSEVSGLYFRRDATAGALVSGPLVELSWKSAPGNDPRDLDRVEGALTAISPTVLTLATPFAGMLNVPRDRVSSLRVVGRGARLLVDNAAHHLGDSISTVPPLLDPPQPEGGVLERSFEIDALPDGPATIVVDVVQVVGEAADLPFSGLIKKGELRTNVSINGSPFDYLNHYITTKNEVPERVRLTVPKKLLRNGKNLIRFEQVGVASDPNYLDDLGLLGIAVEFEPPTKPVGK